MKTLKLKPATPSANVGTVVTKVPSVDPRLSVVKIFHQQGIKQSIRYQTGDVSFAVELHTLDNPKAIQAGIERAELLVENALAPKLVQMGEILSSLADKNG